jgi:hypothetical protein
MRNRAFSAAALLAAGLAIVVPALLDAQAIQRSLYVSVVDRSGAPVPDIRPSDLVVREDDVAREILNVVPATEPMQIALLVDNSQASEPYIRDYRQAFPAFVQALAADPHVQGRHQVAVIALASRPTILTEYTTDTDRVLQAVQRLFAQSDSGTYLLDGIIEVSKGITKRESARPVVVAVTTEGPELSDRQSVEVLEPLVESGAALHVMIVGSPRNQDVERGIVITRGPTDTGGSYTTVLAGTALAGRMKQLANELTRQYRVTYARPPRLIPPEKIKVAATRPEHTARGTAVTDRTPQERP